MSVCVRVWIPQGATRPTLLNSHLLFSDNLQLCISL